MYEATLQFVLSLQNISEVCKEIPKILLGGIQGTESEVQA